MQPAPPQGGETAASATHVQDALAVERDEAGDRGRFDAGFVASLHPLRLRLVRLQGRASGAEFRGLLARVFELGPRIGVDELSGLDSLEAVPF